MNTEIIVSIVIVAIFNFIMFTIGVFGWAKKLDSSAKDYFVASRSLGFIALFFTYTATYHSASAFLGQGGFFYSHGVAYWAIGPFTQALGGILMYFFGAKVWLLGSKYNYYTPSEMLGDFYDSKLLNSIVGIVLAAFTIPYIQLQLVGAGTLTESITFGTVPYAVGSFILGLVVMIYVFLGGMRSVAWTDILMGVFMFLAIFLGTYMLTAKLFGGPLNAWALAIKNTPENMVLPGGLKVFSYRMVFSWIIVITLGLSVAAPTVMMRMFSAKSIRTLKWVALLSPLYLTWIYIPYVWYGIATRATSPGLPTPDNILPTGLYQNLPVWFAALICSGGLAAMLSTANSQLHSGSALLTRDLYCIIKKDASEKEVMWVGRIGVVIIFAFSFYASLNRPPLLNLLVALATSGMAQIIPMLVGATMWPRATKQGAYAGFIVGIGLVIVQQLGGFSLFGMMNGFSALIANSILFVIISLLTKPAKPEKIEQFHGYLQSEEAKELLKI